jgi:hypothetical protein
MKKTIIIAIVAIVVIGLGAFLMFQDAKDPQSEGPFAGKTSRELALMCEQEEYVVQHIHPVLTIMVEGNKLEIPANIGIEAVSSSPSTHEQAQQEASCLHFLHTHDNTGTLHVESPVAIDYKLSDFFAVWDQSFSVEQVFSYKADDTHRIKVTVNGQENTEYGDIILRDHDQIVISYEKK